MATSTSCCYVVHSFDLNVPCGLDEPVDEDLISSGDSAESRCDRRLVGCKRKRTSANRSKVIPYQNCGQTLGGIVKASGDVLRVRSESRDKPPNVICRVEELGKLIMCFDDLRRGWVYEMGFGDLFYLVKLKLPRALCYWLMTPIDPVKKRLDAGGVSYRLTSNQVRWVVGLPRGDICVPFYYDSDASYMKVVNVENKYGQAWTSVDGRSGKVVTRKGFAVTQGVLDGLMSKFEVHEVDEFKTLFLMAALDMVLCPTQCSRFPRELLPALACASQEKMYNWCGLVLDKLMASAKRFARRFYSEGFAGGCGGCTLFLPIFYMDRLNRNVIAWGTRPRIKVWTDVEVKKACDEDRLSGDGDFGAARVLDLAYGENHPFEARDAVCPSDDEAAFP